MTIKEFKKDYLQQYCIIEKDFMTTIDYVSISKTNFATFSSVYLKILLSIGSEIDVMKDLLCKLLNIESIKKLTKIEPNFQSVIVDVKSDGLSLEPWRFEGCCPTWWTVYNEVKHNRNERAEKFDPAKKYYEYANLENVLSALAGLYSIELLCFKIVADNNNEKVFVPCINSIFQIKNLYWENVINGSGYVFMDGNLFFDD